VIPQVSFLASVVVSRVARLYDSVVGHGVHDWSSQVEVARCDSFIEVKLNLSEGALGVLVILRCLDKHLDDDRAFVDCYDLDLGSVHSENRRHPISEGGDAVRSIELIKSPIETHRDHD